MVTILGRGPVPQAARADAARHSVVVASRVPTKRRRENCMARLLPFRGSASHLPLPPHGSSRVGRHQLRIPGPPRLCFPLAFPVYSPALLFRPILSALPPSFPFFLYFLFR